MAQGNEVVLRGGKGAVYLIQPVPLLLMTCRRKEPGNQQPRSFWSAVFTIDISWVQTLTKCSLGVILCAQSCHRGARYGESQLLCQPTFVTHCTLCGHTSWASYEICKIAGCACTGNAGNVFPATNFKGNRLLAILAFITARASRTWLDACRDR